MSESSSFTLPNRGDNSFSSCVLRRQLGVAAARNTPVTVDDSVSYTIVRPERQDGVGGYSVERAKMTIGVIGFGWICRSRS
jgi:hypothetical protein